MTSSMPQFPPQPNPLGGVQQDFVLFDDPMNAGNATTAIDNVNKVFGNAGNSSNNNNTSAAFTQYRNSTGSQGTSGSGMAGMPNLNESPFSSPASKPEDDFITNSNNILSSTGSNPQAIIPNSSTSSSSGTLAAQGAPKSKRARGHGYSSSWTGGSLEQHLHQLQQAQAPNMAATGSFGGFSNASDWSGSDTSPQNPPSGSFGPPIHSLSLGEAGQNDAGGINHFASLFPATFSGSNTNLADQDNNTIQSILSTPSQAQITAQQQEDRARQQIQADLMGVDSRALKGQLRDIKHGAFLPNAATSQGNVLFPNVPITPFAGDPTMNGVSSNPTSEIRANAIAQALSSGSFGENQGILSGIPNMTSTPYSAAGGIAGISGNNTPMPIASSNNNFQLPAQPTRKFSERTQNAVNRAKAQKPTRKRMTREGSGLTVSPQEAFLDYEDVDSVLQAAAARQNPISNANGPNVFSSAPGISGTSLGMAMPGLISIDQSANPLSGNSTTGNNLTDMPLARGESLFTLEGTPSLIDGSSSGGSLDSRATSAIPSPPTRMSLSRGDTVRPSKAQQDLMAASKSPTSSGLQTNQSSSSDQQSSQGSIFSKGDLGMLSPTDSVNSSTDDEDEKPYFSNDHQKRSSATNKVGGNAGNSGTHQAGPRFSVVSSSSSESEDDLPRMSNRGRGTALGLNRRQGGGDMGGFTQNDASGSGQQDRRPRMMGGYGYMGSSEESGLFAQPNPMSLQKQSQQAVPMSMEGILQNYPNWAQGTIPSFPAGFNVGPMNPPSLDTSLAQATVSQQRQNQPPSSGDGAASETGSQSQDEGSRQSPSIRSSAQVINPFQGGGGGNRGMMNNNPIFAGQNNLMGGMFSGQMTPTNANPQFYQQQQQQQQFGPANVLQQTNGADTPKQRNRSRTRTVEGTKSSGGRKSLEKVQRDESQTNSVDEDEDEDEDWEETDEDVNESEGSPFEKKEKRGNASSNSTSKSKNSGSQTRKKKSGTNSTNVKRKSRTSQNAGTSNQSGGNSSSHITVCDYISPLTGETCGTEFHRPYDLARHRETIHAREEATLLKQNEITKEQCVVLYKEVDPAKSMATVEWRCDGQNGCGALFSRKDALLRHRRIRNH